MSVDYFDKTNTVSYDVPVTSFLPTIAVCDSFWDTIVERKTDGCNNVDYWDVYFVQQGAVEAYWEYIPAVNCEDLIESWEDVSYEKKNSFFKELQFPGQLCPNVTSFEIEG